jgi:GNAT superfamily N-acetyltransferase
MPLRRRRRALGDILRRTTKAEDLRAREGVRLTPTWAPTKSNPKIHAYDVHDAHGQQLGELVLRVVEFRDTPDDAGNEYREGLEVSGIKLVPAAQRRRLGTKLYEVAAEAACTLGLPLVSDDVRSPFAEAFWRKQTSKGRAYPVEGRGHVYAGPRVDAEEHLYQIYLQEEVRGAGAKTEAELARKDPARFARAQDRVQERIAAWRERLPRPHYAGSDEWDVQRYVLNDTCTLARDLSGLPKKSRRKRRRR